MSSRTGFKYMYQVILNYDASFLNGLDRSQMGHFNKKIKLLTGKAHVYPFCAVQAESIPITQRWPHELSSGPSGVCPPFLTTY